MEQHNHKALSLSIGEEAKAFSDYRSRAEENKGTELEELFLHLADEEAKHLAMLVVQLSDECETFKEYLDEFYGKDVLTTEKD
jgi:hypothetical protein